MDEKNSFSSLNLLLSCSSALFSVMEDESLWVSMEEYLPLRGKMNCSWR